MKLKPSLLLLVTLLVCAGYSTASRSRNGTARVQWLSEGSFAVHVFGREGSTADDMGRRAMLEACATTRDRGYAYYGVNEFRSGSSSQEVETRSEGTDYVVNANGQAVGAIQRPAQYTRYRSGEALLSVTMLNPGSVSLLGGSMEIVDANTCLVYTRPD